jgi:pyruvate dehydrogenase E2 component (dihydrolipoamide acetyltransferase)
MIKFTMPSLGSDMDEGKLTEWLVKPGDTVSRGQIVAVVETTKAAVEIECWHDGTVGELLVSPGETVQVGTALATLIGPGEVNSTPAAPAVIHAAAAPTAAEPLTSESVRRPPRGVGARRWVSPAARRLAASKGVDLEALTGSGLNGAITLEDVERATAVTGRVMKEESSKRRDIRSSIAAAMSC